MPKLRTLFCPLMMAAVAGCATPGNPTGSKFTSKTPEAYAACVLPKWQEIAPLTTQKAISNGYRFIAPSAVTSDEVLEVVKYQEGSRATFYKGSFLSTNKLGLAAKECLD